MKTVHHIESADELLKAFSNVRFGGDRDKFPYIGNENHLELSLSDFSLKLIGETSDIFQLDLGTKAEVADVIVLVFKKSGIDLRIVK